MKPVIDRPGLARRRFVAALTLAPLIARSATQSGSKRLAIVSMYDAQATPAAFAGAMKGLASRGWVEGARLQVLVRSGPDDLPALEAMIREVIAWKPDVILTEGTIATAALQGATRSIPVVTSVADPVAAGFAKSLARPGGNITGLSQGGAETANKMVELLRLFVPGVRRLALFFYAENPIFRELMRHAQDSSRAAGVEPVLFAVRDSKESLTALRKLRSQGIQAAVWMLGEGPEAARDLAREAIRVRIPLVGRAEDEVAAGMLMCVENDNAAEPDRQAAIIVQIFHGAIPSEVPFQFPDRFRIIINRVTARAVGLKLSPAILLRADRVID